MLQQYAKQQFYIIQLIVFNTPAVNGYSHVTQ